VSLSRRLLFKLATSDRFERAVRSVPGGDDRAYAAARRYVAGRSRDDALRVARELTGRGLAVAVDFFGEDERDPAVAARVAADYAELGRDVAALGGDVCIALDLSHLAIDTDAAAARDHLIAIAQSAPVQVGAEDSARTDLILDCVIGARRAGARVSATLQANLLRSTDDASRLAAAGVPVRLVKGAYVEPPAIAYPYGEQTDRAFARLAHQLHGDGAALTLATHDPVLRDALLPALPGVGVEQLLGVRPADADALAAVGRHVRVYVPYGQAWFRYWMRRIAESRGA
jgi:proline dehydrogenase